MLEQVTNSPALDILQRGLQAASLRQEVISNNIANVNTPGYKKSDVVFEDLLAREIGIKRDNRLSLARTRDKHIGITPEGKAAAVVELQNTTTMRVDGNNVDIDAEMAALAKNQIYYSALAKKAGGYLQKIKTVITSK